MQLNCENWKTTHIDTVTDERKRDWDADKSGNEIRFILFYFIFSTTRWIHLMVFDMN